MRSTYFLFGFVGGICLETGNTGNMGTTEIVILIISGIMFIGLKILDSKDKETNL